MLLVLIFIVSVFRCSCCFSLKGCVSQGFSNDDILNMQEWMAVCSITIKGALGWDYMTHTTHSTTQPSGTKKIQVFLWLIKNNYIPSLQPSIYPKHHKYGKHSLAHSKSHHSCLPLLCSIPHFAISTNTFQHLNHLAWAPGTILNHPATIHPSALSKSQAPPVVHRYAHRPLRYFDGRPGSRSGSSGVTRGRGAPRRAWWSDVRPRRDA